MQKKIDLGANIKTGIEVKPERSHNFIIIISIISALCFGVGFFFLWMKHEYSWIPLSIGGITFISSLGCWGVSYKGIDLIGASPTTIKDYVGNQITTDTRALSSRNSMKNLEQLCSILNNRKELPKPDGKLDKFGKAIPESKDIACKEVEEINTKMKSLTTQFDSLLSPDSKNNNSDQPILEGAKEAIGNSSKKGEI